ncbi:hypothetical protein PFISCL1PPCAC_24832 [Pristionchus fissidentatus]|uniref:Uncharacterized protein n=1 Tax=Pristionchus fissidentatus TaxID=1538716 RepID=A0AAV5WSE1_9BILA|nr:hypothetical protein PFISCL1PPCAC_24832 [Pristionchus fissidentatus]
MKIILFFFAATLCISALGTRYVNLKGQLSCDNTYDYRDTIIELWERDTIDSDDKKATIKPRFDGSFNITGEETEIGAIQFYLKITHRCLLVDRKDCKSLTEEFDVDSSSDPKTITHFKKSLVSRQQTHVVDRNCLI